MTRRAPLWVVAIFAASLFGLVGCNKPKTADCKKAIDNIQKLTGTAETSSDADREGAIRACRGNANDKSVQCYIAATTLEELGKCGGGMYEKMLEESKAE